ncbi:hypothetical protein D3P96_01955 [Weissella viridescens]|uniref:Uncharacterized protein n=1 Tax=Weissella viridescens TaxID=1629 RepID=A0A3P2RH90_WEIVI|nr:hypothetical protein [Weissella viridescens]RRG18771.1 hypothetical protein D3P96_01955 [Weissella viridescens]
MDDYTEKEQKVIANIADTLSKLDDNLNKLDVLESGVKSHSIKEWAEEHKAIHEIKHILSEIGKYGKYDEKEALADEKELEAVIRHLDKYEN